ncbi:MAG: protein arginine kinase [candidate division WOR-3 bacterium]|nr:protein arginine kinase [candidate division WOR-3 bacterium]
MKTSPRAFINQTLPAWLTETNNKSSIVLTCRVRYARNLAGFPFPSKATDDELNEVLKIVNTAINKNETLSKIFDNSQLIVLEKLTPLQAEFLTERHLISYDFIQHLRKKNNKEHHLSKQAVFINQNETISLMINEEDHLRFQALSSGINFANCLKILNEIDDCLESELKFAYSSQYGFLTACPSNVGTGLRASVLIHLPGLVLTKEIEKVLRAIWQIGYSVRGFYGEGTETRGYFFQISNTVTLGVSEPEIIEGIEKVTNQIIDYEERAREYLFKNTKSEMEDKIYRAYAILKSARLISSEEALNLLATVRLGIATGVITDIPIYEINKMMLLVRPANLQILYNQEMSPQERDEKRASLIRELLKDISSN